MFFRRENLMASLLFCIVSYGLLSTGFTLSIQLMKSRINITLIFTDSCFDNHYSIIIYYSEKPEFLKTSLQ